MQELGRARLLTCGRTHTTARPHGAASTSACRLELRPAPAQLLVPPPWDAHTIGGHSAVENHPGG
eukprot:728525-Pyramimonas_sp.AAC.1